MTKAKKPDALKVLVDNAVSDGKGGYLPKGHALADAADLPSLKAKGLVG